MNILLVNDDGINSERLKHTEEVLKAHGDVIVVAPSEEQSGMSISITIGGFSFKKLDDKHFAVDGTPADCVTFALYGLKLNPDVIVSGTNDGYNIGVDAMYSGTVGAALQGLYHGFKSIALSADPLGYRLARKELSGVVQHVFNTNLSSKDYILNINLPLDKHGEAKGILNTKTYPLTFDLSSHFEDDNYFYLTRNAVADMIPKDSDRYAVNEGYVSIAKVYPITERK